MTKRTYMCDYGSCTNTMPVKEGKRITITISWNGSRTNGGAFCCEKHAALWLYRNCSINDIDELTEELLP